MPYIILVKDKTVSRYYTACMRTAVWVTLFFSGVEGARAYITHEQKDVVLTDTTLVSPSIDASERLDEVVLSAVFSNSSVRSIPLPIKVVSQQNIDKSMSMNVIDAVQKNTPGFTALKTGPNISKPFIRGLGYNRVLTLFDGIRQEGQQWGDEHGLEIDDYNIERVEVIKGPASLIYGSDALAGVVSFHSPEYMNDTKGTVHGKYISEYQTNNGLFGNGGRIMWGQKRWAIKFGGSFRAAHNYRNKADGFVFATNFQTYNIFGGVQYTSKHGHSDIEFTVYDNLQAIPDGSRDANRRFTKQIFEGAEDKAYEGGDSENNREVVSDRDLRSYKIPILHQRIQFYRLIVDNQYELGQDGKAGNLKVLVGGTQSVRREFLHPTNAKRPSLHLRQNTLNYNVRYASPIVADAVDFNAGVNGMFQNSISMPDATDFPIPNFGLASVGTYFTLRAKLAHHKVSILAGVRYDMRSLNAQSLFSDTTNPDFPHQTTARDGNVEQLYESLHRVFKGLSLSVGVTWSIIPQLVLKANFARGFRAPNVSELLSGGLDPGAHLIYNGKRDAKPEFSYQGDIGVELSLPDVTFSASTFFNYLQNYIYFRYLLDANGVIIRDAQQNRTLVYDQSAARLYGVESNLSIHPHALKGWRLDNAFFLIHGDNLDPSVQGKGSLGGQYLQLIPPLRFWSSLSKEIKFSNDVLTALHPMAEVDYTAKQNRFYGVGDTETETPQYTLFNFSVGFDFGRSKRTRNSPFSLYVQLNNAFDKVYQSNLSRLKYFENDATRVGNAGDRSLRSGIYSMGRNVVIKFVAYF